MPYEIADVILPGNDGAFDIGKRKPAARIDELAAEHRGLLDGPVTAVLATTKANGRAQLTPVWVNHDGTHLFLNSVRDRVKDRNLRARPDLTLLLLNPENPYHWLSIEGTVVAISPTKTTPSAAIWRPIASTRWQSSISARRPILYVIRRARCGSSTRSSRRRS